MHKIYKINGCINVVQEVQRQAVYRTPVHIKYNNELMLYGMISINITVTG